MLNAAARVITGTRKFDRGLGQILHNELHWLDVTDRVFCKLAATVHRCLNSRAPLYLSDFCVPAAGADTRRQLRSSNRQLLAVPRYRLNTYCCRAFSVAGSTAWNSLPDFIRDPTTGADCFRRLFKMYLFTRYLCTQRVRGSLTITALYKYTYLLIRGNNVYTALTVSSFVNSPYLLVSL